MRWFCWEGSGTNFEQWDVELVCSKGSGLAYLGRRGAGKKRSPLLLACKVRSRKEVVLLKPKQALDAKLLETPIKGDACF
jgi:hypothetical protein